MKEGSIGEMIELLERKGSLLICTTPLLNRVIKDNSRWHVAFGVDATKEMKTTDFHNGDDLRTILEDILKTQNGSMEGHTNPSWVQDQ